ncbi:hypothetical protein [Candidatus Amarolinea dominans]|uniref:hypothetical protein n=1 Tax=Candidatus Amarolinea dominans TaxID=3140696 RepID=UPI0031CCA8F4
MRGQPGRRSAISTDVRDAVRAYWLATQQGQAGEAYNVGSGQPRSIQSILDFLLAGVRPPVGSETDPGRLRPRMCRSAIATRAIFGPSAAGNQRSALKPA